MARTVAELPEGTRITDYISLGVITKTFPFRQALGFGACPVFGVEPCQEGVCLPESTEAENPSRDTPVVGDRCQRMPASTG